MKKSKQQIESLEIEVKSFASKLPYWGKYLAEKILSGIAISDSDIENSYSYLLEELKLKDKNENPLISISYKPNSVADFKDDLKFESLAKVEGVNALIEKQNIEFTPNLTIIYGVNGAGKSGYVRLLKNVFYSKHKQNILENVKVDSGHKQVSAEFNFSSNNTSIQLKYPENSENGIFNQFAVFDGEIGKKHLSERNDFSFRPSALKLFNEFNVALEKLNTRLNSDINSKSILNPFSEDDIFQGDSDIKKFLISLTYKSNIGNLKKHLPYTEDDKENKSKFEKEYDDLKIDLSQKDKIQKDLLNINDQLALRKDSLKTTNLWFTQNQLDIVKSDIFDFKTKDESAKKEGIEKFKDDKIKNIGSPEWRKFIEAAEEFALNQIEDGTQYPEIGDNCLLCHQAIIEDAPKNLILSYWAYIKSITKQEANLAKEKLVKTKLDYNSLDLNQFPKTDILSAWLKENHESDLIMLTQVLEEQKKLARNVVSNIDAIEPKPQLEIQLDLSILDNINIKIDKRIKAFDEDEESKALAILLKQKTYLAHKEKLKDRFADIEKIYDNMIWVKKAHKFNKQNFKTQSTSTEKKLSKVYFNSEYIKSFKFECEELNGKFDIEIDAKSSDAKSNRQLFLKGKDPSAILSEGEQKVVALADFIAETNITTINKGIILDDPVNSLDEERKSKIANRLVEISKNKQVIIFTHDLVFLSSLINFSTDAQLLCECHWIENRNGMPGQIWLRNSPSYEKIYRNSNPVKKIYSDAKKDDCPPEKREYLVKSGFTALRTCYEVLVINDLFKNVVQRFNERVSIDSLSNVFFDETLVSELQESFAQCCRYMEGHTHSDKYAYKKPQLINLNDEIQRFELIKSRIKKHKKSP